MIFFLEGTVVGVISPVDKCSAFLIYQCCDLIIFIKLIFVLPLGQTNDFSAYNRKMLLDFLPLVLDRYFYCIDDDILLAMFSLLIDGSSKLLTLILNCGPIFRRGFLASWKDSRLRTIR